jgi:hypothetical protein
MHSLILPPLSNLPRSEGTVRSCARRTQARRAQAWAQYRSPHTRRTQGAAAGSNRSRLRLTQRHRATTPDAERAPAVRSSGRSAPRVMDAQASGRHVPEIPSRPFRMGWFWTPQIRLRRPMNRGRKSGVCCETSGQAPTLKKWPPRCSQIRCGISSNRSCSVHRRPKGGRPRVQDRTRLTGISSSFAWDSLADVAHV